MIQFESEGFSPSMGKSGGASSSLFKRDFAVQAFRRRVPWGGLIGLTLLSQLFLLVSLIPPLQPGAGFFPPALHMLPELFSVIAATLIFVAGWHAHHDDRSCNVLLLACGFLVVALLDCGYLLSQPGMPAFVTPSGLEKSLNFRLAARCVAVATLIAVACLPWRSLRSRRMRHGLLTASLALAALLWWLASIRPQSGPGISIAGQGFTVFQFAAESGIIVVTLSAAFLFYRKSLQPQLYDVASLCAGAIVIGLAELCFTLWAGSDEVFLLLAAAYKAIACYFIYLAVFISNVQEPYKRLSTALIESKSAEHMVEFLAYHDPLTNLPNRLLLKDLTERAIAHVSRTGTKTVLLYLDLDNFKTVNDSLGRAVGDALLQSVAARLGECICGTDTISRLSGDEFVIIFQNVPSTDAITPAVSKMMERMRQPFDADGHQVITTISVGMAICPDDGGDFNTLMKKADMAMYHAKQAGRNAYRFFDAQMDIDATELLRMRNDLNAALERNEFVLHYQPQIDLASGAVIGAEAVIRWNHPEFGMVPPMRFIPVAEESGLIVPIGEWVMREACRQAQAWRSAGLPPLVVGVNLSGTQFMRSDVERAVVDALNESGLDPALLELELTESILIQEADAVLAAVRRLKDLGVKLSIDDFGTGYSSLSYLRRFAVDRLKIDRSFVRDLAVDPDDTAIVHAIIQMAHSLGLRTIAEGVEDESILKHLQALHCDQVQGFYFAKPMPAKDFARYLAEASGSKPL